MAKIQELLDNLLRKKLGRDVRQSIHDSIEQCYKDATGHPESVAGVIEENKNLKQAMAKQDARINNLAKLPSGSTSGDAELADIRVGAGGEIYDTAGQAVREQIGSLKSDTSRIKKNLRTTYVDMNLFALGTINKDTGEEESSKKILRSIIDVNATEDITIKLPKGYQWNVAHWLAGKYRSDLWNENSWYQNLTIEKTTANYKYRILIRRSDGADITLSELIGAAETNREDLQSFDKIDDLKKKLNEVDKKVDNLSIETDKTLTEEDKPADAKMTGKKISELSKNIEDEKNKNVVTLISKEDFKVIEDSEEITDENKLYSFNSAFSANFISSTNNKYLLSVDDSGQFTANFVKENTEKILLSAFKIESFPEVSNIIYVSLGRQPENDVTLQITSDSNVILSATELTFTKENFFIPQPVSISSNTKTTSIVKIIGKETATIDLIVSGNIRYLFRNGQYASDITVTTDVGYGGTYSISDNLITLGGTIGLILSGVNLKNGDTIIVNCTNANDSSAHYTALQNGGTMLVTRKASDLYADIQLNGNAQIQYTNTTGSTIPDITIKNSFTKFKGDSIRVIEV